MIEKIKELLIKHEGLRLKPYKCPAGKLTIGVGRNIEDNGITKDEALYLLENDIKRCLKELEDIFGKEFFYYPEEIKIVLTDMIFNLGKSKFLKFKKMIQAVKDKNYMEMVKQMEDSKWCRQQVKNRCNELIKFLEFL